MRIAGVSVRVGHSESNPSFHKIASREAVAKPPIIAFARNVRVVGREIAIVQPPRGAVAKPPRIAFPRTGRVVESEMLGGETPRGAEAKIPRIYFLRTEKVVESEMLGGESPRGAEAKLLRISFPRIGGVVERLLLVIHLLGTGQRVVTNYVDAQGIRYTVNSLGQNLIQGTKFINPGASAFDSLGTDLTPAITTQLYINSPSSPSAPSIPSIPSSPSELNGFGEAADFPTLLSLPPGSAATIVYRAVDSAGQNAYALRVLTISCEQGLVACEDPPSGDAPALTLIGPSSVVVHWDTEYLPCTASDAVSAICDRGARAQDALDGDLTDYVQACAELASDEVIAGFGDISFLRIGLSLCGIDTTKPGSYPITFSVTTIQGVRATVVRNVVVVLACPPDSCWLYGCRGYEYAEVGLAPCDLSTAIAQAEIGETLSVRFVVYGDGWPPEADSIERVLVVVDGCSTLEIYLCDGVCSEISPATTKPPTIVRRFWEVLESMGDSIKHTLEHGRPMAFGIRSRLRPT
eukprot:gene13913-19842_t